MHYLVACAAVCLFGVVLARAEQRGRISRAVRYACCLLGWPVFRLDLIDPESRHTWAWEVEEATGRRPMLKRSEVERVSDLWVVACGYCNPAKGRRAPDETDGFRVLPGYGPSNPSRSVAIESVLNPRVGPGRVGTEQGGSDLGGTVRVGPAAVRSSSSGFVGGASLDPGLAGPFDDPPSTLTHLATSEPNQGANDGHED